MDDDAPPPLDDDDAPPPFGDDELDEAPAPAPAPAKKQPAADSSLLGLESKIREEPVFQQTKDRQEPERSAAHEALIANLAPKPKRGETAKKQAEEAERAEVEYKAKAKPQKPIKKGFFDAPAPKKKAGGAKKKKAARAKKAGGSSAVPGSAVNSADDDDIIEVKTPGIEAQDAMGGLQLPEVQAAMAGVSEKQKEWMNPAFMERFMKNPRLMHGFKDPVCQKAMAEMQENPAEAAKKYEGNPMVTEFLKEFMGLMGDHFHNIAEEKEKEEAAKTEAAWPTEGPMADPEVKKIMTDPEFQPVLQDCQQPGRMIRHMHDPRYAPRLNFLISKGVFNVHA
eukprot:SAG22_NODE_29_length_28404_cov_23.294153_16_plen_338_part_00